MTSNNSQINAPDKSSLTLFNYYRSSASYRVRCVLELKGLAYTYKAVHLLQGGGEQYSTEFLRLNPMGQVPTLIDRGFEVSQSLPIAEYLEDAFPERTPLLPKDLKLRAWIRQFCEIINCTQPMQNLATLNRLKELYGVEEKDRLMWLNPWFDKAFSSLEKMVEIKSKGESKFCFGDQVTLADCFLAPQAYASKRLGYSLDRYPKLQSILVHLEKHPAFRRAHPHRQPDTPEELRET